MAYDRITDADFPSIKNGNAGADSQLKKLDQEAKEYGSSSKQFSDRLRWINHATDSNVRHAEATLEKAKDEHRSWLGKLFSG